MRYWCVSIIWLMLSHVSTGNEVLRIPFSTKPNSAITVAAIVFNTLLPMKLICFLFCFLICKQNLQLTFSYLQTAK